MPRLLVVEDDSSLRGTVVTFLELEGYQVDAAPSTRIALEKLQSDAYAVVISDIYMDERTGLDILKAAKTANPDCGVILMSGRGSMETVMKATQHGAADYLAKPFDLDQLLLAVKKVESEQLGVDDDDEIELEDLPDKEMTGSSPQMVELYKAISRVAPTDATVLIEGETGTGKELLARMVHRNSPRAPHPFIAVDCGAIAPSLLDSELFGAVRGAYTGADRDRAGVFEAAHLGTVFLDEIGEIDMGFQLKLLRFLQEKEIRPVGASRGKQIDVRVVAATNKDLRKLVESEKFREDLYYRLNVVYLRVPPLRERRGDVPLLAHLFVQRANGRYKLATRLTEGGLQALTEYTWPGNVRQLQHLIERLCILAPNGRIEDFGVREAVRAMQPGAASSESLADTENDQIRRVLAATSGNKSRAAKILGIERKTLYRKLERLGL